MKLKVKSNRRGVTLKGETAAAEELLYSEAECVKSGCDETLLTFSYEQKKKGYAFEYYVGTARPIREVLSMPLPREYFEPMLISFLDLARTCDMKGLSVQRVSFEEEHIFFDPARYSLRFVYMPVRGVTERISSPLEALEELTKRARFDDEGARGLADRVLDHVRRSAIFSWIEYETFLREQGVLDKPDGDVRDTSLLDGRTTTRIDCRDSYGFDFMSEQATSAVQISQPAQAPVIPRASQMQPAACQEPKLVRMLDGVEWPLKPGSNVIGAAQECDICLEGVEGISRQHAALQVGAHGCQIMDLNSTNGVTVDGKRIPPGAPVALERGSRIHIARMQLTLTC